jgi:hypothetical protein
MDATFSLTSCAAKAPSISRLNSTTIKAYPSLELEEILFTPEISFTTSSTFFVISVSTDSADAPG